ncbi:MAG: group II intron reverse transcriptase domain-containing protein [Candidatus Kerfeldbacteria bacterium]|nr:group II intron reverse transcriptase domain-containing protein [Candidatus Kerfeldbacteria bacterium]
MRIQFTHSYQDIISMENLLEAWQEFRVGKRGRHDVQGFEMRLMQNIFSLHRDLRSKTYQHSTYESFNISDPKPRNIHKASVRDRLLHHAVYRMLYPFFDRTFIADSYSCRLNKGTHKALRRFRMMTYQVSKNNTKTCWVLQCDIKKFFASINQRVLLDILSQYISDQRILTLLRNIIESFSMSAGTGLPLGNLTSQLLVNVYMNEFDQFVKHKLKAKYYIRYADDFVLISDDRDWLMNLIPQIREFLTEKLRLTLHPNKVSVKTLASGVDFLGWVHFPTHRVLRTATKHGMMRKVREHATNETLQSYLGLLKHGNTHKIRQKVLNEYWLWHEV